MKSEIIKTAEIYRFPRLKNHIEEFIAHDLPWVLEDLRDYGLISGFCYTCKLTYDFRKGVDFYIFLGDKEIPVQ